MTTDITNRREPNDDDAGASVENTKKEIDTNQVINQICKTLSNPRTLRMFLEEDFSLQGKTKKEYYHSMIQLKESGLVVKDRKSRRNERRYLVTAFGKQIYHALQILQKAVANHNRLKAYEKVQKLDGIDEDLKKEMLNQVITDEGLRRDLLESESEPNVLYQSGPYIAKNDITGAVDKAAEAAIAVRTIVDKVNAEESKNEKAREVVRQKADKARQRMKQRNRTSNIKNHLQKKRGRTAYRK